MATRSLWGMRRIGVRRDFGRAISMQSLLLNLGKKYKRTHKSKITKVYVGKSYGRIKFAKRKPKGAVKIGSTAHMIRYAKGKPEFLVPRKGVKLIRSRGRY